MLAACCATFHKFQARGVAQRGEIWFGVGLDPACGCSESASVIVARSILLLLLLLDLLVNLWILRWRPSEVISMKDIKAEEISVDYEDCPRVRASMIRLPILSFLV